MKTDIVDFSVPDAAMHIAKNKNGTPFWDSYYEDTAHQIFKKGGLVVDLGGGLRIDATRGDRADAKNVKRFAQYLTDPNVTFHVTDYTDKYHPDSTQDIHALIFEDGSIDGLFCLAVLEHVYDPKKAAEEVTRVLKPGGIGLLYVPFIYRYHATVTEDYRDYYRYSKDGLAYLFRGCASIELCPVRGLFESLLRFTPLHTLPGLSRLARWIDWSSQKMISISQKQASGYFIKIIR